MNEMCFDEWPSWYFLWLFVRDHCDGLVGIYFGCLCEITVMA